MGILFTLALAVGLLRFHRLTEFPPELHNDEGAHGINALEVLQGEHAAFFPENHGREGLIVYAIALSISFLGRTALAIRLPTALASAGTVFVLFWLGQILFGRDEGTGQATPWRGLMVGGVGGRSAGSFTRSDDNRAHGDERQFPAIASFALSDPALAGVEATELVADRVGWRLCWAAPLHIYSRAVRTLSISLLWIELSCPPWLGDQGENTD